MSKKEELQNKIKEYEHQILMCQNKIDELDIVRCEKQGELYQTSYYPWGTNKKIKLICEDREDTIDTLKRLMSAISNLIDVLQAEEDL